MVCTIRQYLLVGTLLFVVLLIPMPVSAQELAQPAEKLPPLVGPDYVPGHYQGRVVTLTDKTMTLKLVGRFREDLIWYDADGIKQGHLMYIQDNNQPPKEFTLNKGLFPGKDGKATNTTTRYLVTDVRVGDIVLITCNRDHCHSITIQRRPGGKVPPALRDEMTTKEHRWDVRCNTAQAAEERAAAMLKRFGLSFPR